MTARAISRRTAFRKIRPIDPVRDAKDVVNLIEEAFSGELNPMAQKVLRDLHWLGRLAWIMGPFLWMTPFAELFSGLVWTEGRRVVGNVTITRSRGGGPGCWLISNVVVAPAYRGQGIGRALMEEALAFIRSKGGRRVILQVRADNQAAVHLYQDMGFIAVDTLLEMCLPQPWPPIPSPPALPLHWRGYREGLQEYLLACEAIPSAAQEMYPPDTRKFRVTWEERMLRLVKNLLGSTREYRFGITEDSALRATLTVWAGRRCPYHRLGIMVHPQHRGKWEQGLVDHALALLQRYPFHPVYAEAYAVHDALVRALTARGFVTDRELVQMKLDLTETRC